MSLNETTEEKYITEPHISITRDRASTGLPIFSVLNSSSPYIFIIIQEKFHVAGERIEGEIILDIPECLPESQLVFESRGVEELRIFKSFKLISERIHKIFSFSLPIRFWNQLPKGHYIVPFTFLLPHFGPSTFYFSGEDSSKNYIKASINYYISAKLVCQNDEISYTRLICVRNALCKTSPKIEVEKKEKIVGPCCYKRGISSLKIITYGEDHPVYGDRINYQLFPDNSKCKVPIGLVIAQIVRELTFAGKTSSFELKNIISKVTRMIWIPAFSSLAYDKDCCFSSEIRADNEDFNVSSNNSVIVKCSYYIEVISVYENRLKKQTVEVRVPFNVNPIPYLNKDIPKLPKDWKGEIHPAINLIFDAC